MGVEDELELQQVQVEEVDGMEEVLLVVNPMHAEPGRPLSIKQTLYMPVMFPTQKAVWWALCDPGA